MINTEIKTAEDMRKLPVSTKAKFCDATGVKVGKMLNATLKKANKILNPLGFHLDIEMHFKELPKE
jgi:hypothetical protein